MFGRKYVFETRATRNKRFFLNMFIASLVAFSLLAMTCLFLPYYAYDQNEVTAKAFYKREPDLIAVYTGDSGRLSYIFREVGNYPTSKVFISGVYTKNSLQTLINEQGAGIVAPDFLNEEGHHIEIDYMARNTVENVISTLRYLQRNRNIQNVLIISSDYHILRIKLIVSSLKEDSSVNFYFHGITSNYKKWRNWKIVFKEVYKLLKTSLFLFFYN